MAHAVPPAYRPAREPDTEPQAVEATDELADAYDAVDDTAEADDELGVIEQPPEGLSHDEPERRPTAAPDAPTRDEPTRDPPRPHRVGFGGATFEVDDAPAPGPFSAAPLPDAEPVIEDSAKPQPQPTASLDPSMVIPEASGLVGTATALDEQSTEWETETSGEIPTGLLEDEDVRAVDADDLEAEVADESPRMGSFLETIRAGVPSEFTPEYDTPRNGHNGQNGHARAKHNGHNGHAAAPVSEPPAVGEGMRPERPPRPQRSRQAMRSRAAEAAVGETYEEPPPRGPKIALLLTVMIVTMVGVAGAIWLLLPPDERVSLKLRYDVPAGAAEEQLATWRRRPLELLSNGTVRTEAIETLARQTPSVRPDWLAGDEPLINVVEADIDPLAGAIRLSNAGPDADAEAARLVALGTALVNATADQREQAQSLEAQLDELAAATGEARRATQNLSSDVTTLVAELGPEPADDQVEQLRRDAADRQAEYDAAATTAADLAGQRQSLLDAELGEGDATIDSLRSELEQVQSDISNGTGDLRDLRERETTLQRQIDQRLAELRGERTTEAQRLRRLIADAEREAALARRAAQQARDALGGFEATQDKRARRAEDLAAKRAELDAKEAELNGLIEQQATLRAERATFAYPLPPASADVARLGTGADRRPTSIIFASLALFALFLIPLYFIARGPR